MHLAPNLIVCYVHFEIRFNINSLFFILSSTFKIVGNLLCLYLLGQEQKYSSIAHVVVMNQNINEIIHKIDVQCHSAPSSVV